MADILQNNDRGDDHTNAQREQELLNAKAYKKKLDATQAQVEQYTNELIETQKESRVYQETLELLRGEKEDILEHVNELKEDISMNEIKQHEEQRLSEEAIFIKDEAIERLKITVETLQIEKQSLEAMISSKEEECKAQEMEINEFTQEIQKLKTDKHDLITQLNEYQQTEKDIKMDERYLSQQLKTQDIQYMHIKQENIEVKLEINTLNQTLRQLKQENQILNKDNMHYKELLSTLETEQHTLKQKIMETEETLEEYEMVCNELTGQCELQIHQVIRAESLAEQYNYEIQEMKQVSELSYDEFESPRRQKTHFLLPQKTINRMNVSRSSRLTVPIVSNSFRNSTQKILSSVMDIHNDNVEQTLLAVNDSFGTDDGNDSASVCTADSYHEYDMDGSSDYSPIPNTPQSPIMNGMHHIGSRDSVELFPNANMNGVEVNVDMNKSIDGIQLLSPQSSQKNRGKMSPFGTKFDIKLFEKRLKEEIIKEMEELENVLRREYDIEFEKNKNELIAAHQESLFVVTNTHNDLTEHYQDLQQKYDQKLEESRPAVLPPWAVFLSHILAL